MRVCGLDEREGATHKREQHDAQGPHIRRRAQLLEQRAASGWHAAQRRPNPSQATQPSQATTGQCRGVQRCIQDWHPFAPHLFSQQGLGCTVGRREGRLPLHPDVGGRQVARGKAGVAVLWVWGSGVGWGGGGVQTELQQNAARTAASRAQPKAAAAPPRPQQRRQQRPQQRTQCCQVEYPNSQILACGVPAPSPDTNTLSSFR